MGGTLLLQRDHVHSIAEGRRQKAESLKGAWLAATLLLLLLPVIGLAQSQTALAPPASGEAPADSVTSRLYDVDASGGDIRFVLEALARRSGANILVSPEVTGEVSAHLKQMPLDSILEYLAQVQGFGWKRDGDTYLVAAKQAFEEPAPPPPAPAPLPEPQTVIWRCRHIKAADLVKVVTAIFPDFKAVRGPGASSPQLQAGQQNAMGGQSASSGSSGSDSSGDSSDDTATTVVLYGPPDQVAKVKALLEQVDTPRPQVAIDVAITEISNTGGRELGINWSWSDLVLEESDPTNGGIRFGKFSKQGMTFTGAVSAMIEDGSAKLLAQPNISVLDNAYAEILIGDRILFPKLAGYTENGTPLYDKAEERVGIYLQIAPRVTDDGQIIMTLYPQVSLVTGFLKTQAGDYPQISTREAKTTVSVADGTTLAIGGLLRDDEIRQASKIPLLGSLPIIGGLFRHTKTTTERTEIVIFLTPKILKGA